MVPSKQAASPARLRARVSHPAVGGGARAAIVLLPLAATLLFHARIHYFQTDDAYISYRYAWNLLHGNGLVFNAGERVEGYTNFLWVLQLAGFWRVFGPGPEVSAVFLSVVYTLLTLAVTALLLRRSALPGFGLPAAAAAFALLAASRTFAVWTTGGLETRSFTFFVAAAVWLQDRREGSARRLALASLCLAGAALTRPEGLMVWGLIVGWCALGMLWRRRFDVARLGALVAPFAVIVGLHFLFRRLYYGEWLPNTWYAKVVRPWPDAGFRYMTLAAIENGLYLYVPLAALGALARLAAGRGSVHCLSALLMAAHAAYLVRVGGDVFEFRPLDFYWPLLTAAAVDGLLAVALLTGKLLRRLNCRRPLAGGLAAAVLFFGVLFLYANLIPFARTMTTGRLRVTEWLAIEDAVDRYGPVSGAPLAVVRAVPFAPELIEKQRALLRTLLPHSIARSHLEHRFFRQGQLWDYGPYRELWDRPEFFPSDCVMAEPTIGVVGFCLPHVTIIDTYGLTDHTVARTPVLTPNSARVLAHDRRADPEYLKRRGANIHIARFRRSLREALEHQAYALRIREGLWMPFAAVDREWVGGAFAGRVYAPELVEVVGDFDDGTLGRWSASPDNAARCVAPAGPFVLSERFPPSEAEDRGMMIDTGLIGGDEPGTTYLTSQGFAPGDGLFLEYYAAARKPDVCDVRLIDSAGAVLARWAAPSGEALQRRLEDLSPWAGVGSVRVQLVDEGGGAMRVDGLRIVRMPEEADLDR